MFTSDKVKTKPDGSYRFTGLATGSYTVKVSSDTRAWVAEPLKDLVLSEGKQTIAHDVRAHAGAVLEGTVVDAASGQPVQGACAVFLFHGANAFDYNGMTQVTVHTDGHFRCHTEPGQYSFRIQRPPRGYLAQKYAEAQTVELHEGTTCTVSVKLQQGQSVTGTVTQADGKPAAGVYLQIAMSNDYTDPHSSYNVVQVTFYSDRDGHFEAAGLPAGNGMLSLSHPRFGKAAEWELPEALPIAGPCAATGQRQGEAYRLS